MAVTRMGIHSIQQPLASSPDEPKAGETNLTPDARTASLVVIAAGVVIFLLQHMQALFAPLAFGVLLYYALNPVVNLMERGRVPRWVGAAVVLLFTIGTLGAGAYILQDEAVTVIDQLPAGARRLSALAQRKPLDAPGPIEKVQEAADELKKGAEPEPETRGAGRAWLAKKKITLEILDSISAQIGRFLLVQIFTSVVVGVATWAALSAIGLNEAALWCLLAGVFNSIPYYGPILVSGGLAGVAFLQFGTIEGTLAVAGVSLAITSLEGWLLTPMLMGRVANMNRVVVFVGLLFWSWV